MLDTHPHFFLLRIASWSARAHIKAEADAALLDEIFKGAVSTWTDAAVPVDAALDWSETSNAAGEWSAVPADELVVRQTGAQEWRIESRVLTVRLVMDTPIAQITVLGHPHTLERLAWRVHVSVVFHKLLLLLGRLYLHAGAVRVGASANAFVAEKWSGKSTICMWLGRAGGTILSDDHILIRRAADEIYVSGCEPVARVTAATEATLFATPLVVEARDFAGVMKKEFRVGDVFDALPYADVPLRRIFFPHVGTAWRLEALTKRAALARLLTATRASFRFADTADYARHLAYFSNLAASVEAFDLELTPDFNELDQLVEFLNV